MKQWKLEKKVFKKLYNEKSEWNTLNHRLHPKVIVNFMDKLHEKHKIDTHGGTVSTSGGIIPRSKFPENLLRFWIWRNVKKISSNMIAILYCYSKINSVYDNLTDLWGLARSPKSPFHPTICTTSMRDPSPTVSSFESSLSLFSKLWYKQISDQQSATALLVNLSGTNFETHSAESRKREEMKKQDQILRNFR